MTMESVVHMRSTTTKPTNPALYEYSSVVTMTRICICVCGGDSSTTTNTDTRKSFRPKVALCRVYRANFKVFAAAVAY